MVDLDFFFGNLRTKIKGPQIAVLVTLTIKTSKTSALDISLPLL